MPLKRLLLSDFRNLHSVELWPAPKLNFLQGVNGSGKTSILEAISTLAMGRSFRTRKYRNIIRLEQNQFSLFAEVYQQPASFKIGVSRQRSGKSLFKLNELNVTSAAELAQVIPFQIINSHSFLLLEGGPTERRRFLDWMVFHVKHDYRRLWSDYARCLKQRNSLLRSDKMKGLDYEVWDATLSSLAVQIDLMRSEVVALFLPELNTYLKHCGFIDSGEVSVEYLRGWDSGSSLGQELARVRDKEQKLGFTTVGPHKADIRIRLSGKDVAELFSRGQQKSVVIAMYMSQMNVFKNKNKRDCLLLIDDLPAELDQTNQQMVCGWVSQLDRVQSFITGIELKPIIDAWPKPLTSNDCKMFHVKHGQVTEQPCDWSNP